MYSADLRLMRDEVFAIETERLRLAVLKKSAAIMVNDYLVRNRAYHKRWAQTQPDSYFTVKMQKEYLKSDVNLFYEERLLPFFIFEKDHPEKVIGRVSLFNIVGGGMQCATIGYHLDEKAVGKGIMSEAVRAACAFGFKELKLHRIEAYVIPYNDRSLSVVRRAGFIQEGERKSYMHINGHWEDHLAFTLFEENLREMEK